MGVSVTAGGGARGGGDDASLDGAGRSGALLLIPPPPPDPPELRGRSGGCGAVGAAPSECRPAGPEACSPDDGAEPTTTGPGCGSATTGVRAGGALSSVALPAATTIMVGTDVSSTSSAEISSGRRLGENSR